MELAFALEATGRDAQPSGINFLERRGSGAVKRGFQEFDCYCCGRRNHKSSECRYKSYNCYKCKKQGHLASVRKSKAQENVNTRK